MGKNTRKNRYGDDNIASPTDNTFVSPQNYNIASPIPSPSPSGYPLAVPLSPSGSSSDMNTNPYNNTAYGTLLSGASGRTTNGNNTGTTDLSSAQRPAPLSPGGSAPTRLNQQEQKKSNTGSQGQPARVNSSIGSPLKTPSNSSGLLFKVPSSPIAPLNPLAPANQKQAGQTDTLAARVQSLQIFPLNSDGRCGGCCNTSVLDRKGYAGVTLRKGRESLGSPQNNNNRDSRNSATNQRWGLDAGRVEKEVDFEIEETSEGVFSHRLLNEQGEEVIRSLFDIVGDNNTTSYGATTPSGIKKASFTSSASRTSEKGSNIASFFSTNGAEKGKVLTQKWTVIENGKMIGCGTTERKETSRNEFKLQTTLYDSHGDPRILVTVNEKTGSLLPFLAVPDSWRNRLQLVDLRTRTRVAVGGWGLTRSLSSLGMWRLGAMEIEIDEKCEDVELRKLALAYLVGAGRCHAAGVDENTSDNVSGRGRGRRWMMAVFFIFLLTLVMGARFGNRRAGPLGDDLPAAGRPSSESTPTTVPLTDGNDEDPPRVDGDDDEEEAPEATGLEEASRAFEVESGGEGDASTKPDVPEEPQHAWYHPRRLFRRGQPEKPSKQGNASGEQQSKTPDGGQEAETPDGEQ